MLWKWIVGWVCLVCVDTMELQVCCWLDKQIKTKVEKKEEKERILMPLTHRGTGKLQYIHFLYFNTLKVTNFRCTYKISIVLFFKKKPSRINKHRWIQQAICLFILCHLDYSLFLPDWQKHWATHFTRFCLINFFLVLWSINKKTDLSKCLERL